MFTEVTEIESETYRWSVNAMRSLTAVCKVIASMNVRSLSPPKLVSLLV